MKDYRLQGTPLTISYKLNKGYIKNDNYCFKNIFLIVDNMTSDLILGTPFLTQIYPFYVNEIGLHTEIMSVDFRAQDTRGG